MSNKRSLGVPGRDLTNGRYPARPRPTPRGNMGPGMPEILTPPPTQDTADAARAAAIRRTHRWMVGLGVTPVAIFAIWALVSIFGGPSEPVVHPLHTPKGYAAVTDAYYGFALPAAWKQNSALSDSSGDFYYNGPGGWAGENESIAKTSPTPSTPVPKGLWAYGVTAPTRFTISDGHRIRVPGTNFAWAVTLTRPGGQRSSAVDVWESNSQTEVWLVVHGSARAERNVLSSLQGSLIN